MTEDETVKLSHLPSKEIAGDYVAPLLDEGILTVTPDHIKIMSLTIPRQRVFFFHLALLQLRGPNLPVHQGQLGFDVEAVKVARGNDVYDGYKITSNAGDKGSILLTRDLAWELLEVTAFFVDNEPPNAT